MGVITCYRCGSGDVDRFSHELNYYICQTCFEELVHSGIKTDIEEFMRSRPKNENIELTREYFEKLFPRKD